MINITKQGNNVIVTSDNPNSFHIGNGELSVPLNTIYYVLDDESDFIQFNSTEKGKILFNGTIGDIQVNGNIVNRENILMELDNVFNSAATGGEGGTAGVLSINGYDGYINLKSINGQSLIGSGNIEIEGGEGGTAGVNKLILGEEDYGWNTYKGDVKLKSNFITFDEGDTGYDIGVAGMSEEGVATGTLWFGFRSTDDSLLIEDAGGRIDLKVNPDILGGGGGSTAGVEAINIGRDIQDWTQKNGVVSFYTSFYDGSYDVSIGGTSFYGLKPIDSSIVLENAGGTVNGNFRCGIKVNEDNFKTINGESIFGSGDITIQGGGGSSDNGFTEWKNGNSISLGNGASSDEMGIAIGSTAESTGQSVAIGRNAKNTDYDQVAIGYGIKNDDVFYTNINDVIKGDVNKYAFILTEYGNYVRIPTEWTGTQSQYDALGEYYDNITYNIIEG